MIYVFSSQEADYPNRKELKKEFLLKLIENILILLSKYFDQNSEKFVKGLREEVVI